MWKIIYLVVAVLNPGGDVRFNYVEVVTEAACLKYAVITVPDPGFEIVAWCEVKYLA